MSREIVFEALAFLEGYNPSPSMKGMTNSNQIHEVYIKNAVVSLISIKQHNPQTDVGIVLNFQIGQKWKKLLERKGILIWNCPFKDFQMPQDIVYSLSYYKLCAFKYLVEQTKYDKFCFIDCDTFAVKNFNTLWKECEDAFMIVPADESLAHPVRREIAILYEKLYEKERNITHYCSGFIISAREAILSVLLRCNEIYGKIIETDSRPAGGDEIIWSLALADMNISIYSPKVYCLLSNIGFKQYWVDKADYHDNNIVMWHLPAEKRYALVWAYKYYEKKGKVPNVEKMAKACRIRMIKNQFSLLSLQAILQDTTVLKRNLLKVLKRKCGD